MGTENLKFSKMGRLFRIQLYILTSYSLLSLNKSPPQMLFWILAALTVFIIFALSLGKIISAPGHSGPETSHFNGKKFLNTSRSQAKGVTEVLKWIARRDQGPWAKNYETKVGPKPSNSSESLLITFVNHSTLDTTTTEYPHDPIWRAVQPVFCCRPPARDAPSRHSLRIYLI